MKNTINSDTAPAVQELGANSTTVHKLAEASEAVKDGTATDEQKALVDGFHAGANAAIEVTTPLIDDPIERAVVKTGEIHQQIEDIDKQLNDPSVDDNVKQDLESKRGWLSQHLDFFGRRVPKESADEATTKDRNGVLIDDPIERAQVQAEEIRQQLAEIDVRLNDTAVDDNEKIDLATKRNELSQHLEFFETRLPKDVEVDNPEIVDDTEDIKEPNPEDLQHGKVIEFEQQVDDATPIDVRVGGPKHALPETDYSQDDASLAERLGKHAKEADAEDTALSSEENDDEEVTENIQAVKSQNTESNPNEEFLGDAEKRELYELSRKVRNGEIPLLDSEEVRARAGELHNGYAQDLGIEPEAPKEQSADIAEQPAIEAAPKPLAIEGRPEALAIEGSPDRPELESAEKKAIEAAPEDALPELSFTGGTVKDTLKHVGEEAVDRMEDEKTEMAASMQGLGRFRRIMRSIRLAPRNIKFSTLFKKETERKRGQEVMESLLEDEQSAGEVFDPGRYLEVVHGQSVRSRAEIEAAMLEALENDEIMRAGDTVLRGEGEQESPVVSTFRAGLKERLFTYLEASADDAIDEDRRAELVAEYEWEVQELITETIANNPQFTAEAFNVMSSNMFELMEDSRAYLHHEDGKQKLEHALDTMKINIGQTKIGPNSSYNTEYLDRTVDLMQRRRVGSVIGKTSFVVGTWLATGALSAGVSQWAAQSASSAGVRGAAAAAGGALLGPVGAVVGFGAGVAVSAWWGRHLARERATETVAMMEVKSGDSGLAEKTALFRQLQQDTVSYRLTTEGLRSYFDLPVGESEFNPATATLRSNLSQVELSNLINGIAEVQVRLNVERTVNTAAIAGNTKREINLFEASDAGSAQVERAEMVQVLQLLNAQLEEKYGETGIPVPGTDAEGNPRTIELENAIGGAAAASASELRDRMAQVDSNREAFVAARGREGAIVAGSITALVGLSAAGAAEMLTHGNATTIFDAVGVRGNRLAGAAAAGNILQNPNTQATTIKGGNVEIQYNQVGASKVEVTSGGKNIVITSPSGQQAIYHPSARGVLSPIDVNALKQQGIDILQNPDSKTTTKTFGIEKFLRKNGGEQTQVDQWFTNGTPNPDGTELGANISMTKAGDIIVGQDAGIATGPGGQTIDILAAAKDKDLFAYFTHGDTAVKVPLHVTKSGNIQYTIPHSSPLHALFEKTSDGHVMYKGDMWHIGVKQGKGLFDSISTVFGLDQSDVKVDVTKYTNDISVVFNDQGPGGLSFIPVGPAFSGDHDRLYDRSRKTTIPSDMPLQQPIQFERKEPKPQQPAPVAAYGPDVAKPPHKDTEPQLRVKNIDDLQPGKYVVVNGDVVEPVEFVERNDHGWVFRYSKRGNRSVTFKPNQADGVVGWINSGSLRGPIDGKSKPSNPQPHQIDTPQSGIEEQPGDGIDVQTDAQSKQRTSPDAHSQEEIMSGAAQVLPLSPQQIIERLSESSLPENLMITINGEAPQRVVSVKPDNGAPRLIMEKVDGSPNEITLDSLRDAIGDGKVRFNKFLGTPDAGPIVRDIREGEIFYGNSTGKAFRIMGTVTDGFEYQEIDANTGEPVTPNEPPKSVSNLLLKMLVESGSFVPGEARGVRLT